MKRFLFIVFLLLLSFGFVGASEKSNFTFMKQAEALHKEVYPQIREYLKTVDLDPYEQEKGVKVVNDVEEIVTSSNKLFIANKPLIELFANYEEGHIYFRLSVVIGVFDNETMPGIPPVIVFGKYFFVKSYKIIEPPPSTGEKHSA